MKTGFRFSMSALHTWAGLLLSGLLFAIFWTGTLSVFDKEIDRWMMPQTRINMDTAPKLSVDRDIVPLLNSLSKSATAWSIVLPSERKPFVGLGYDTKESHIAKRNSFHPVTLDQLPASNTRGASRFIYPFHHNLTLRKSNIGAWLVGIASIGMLCLLVSGIVIHRRLFTDFFSFRVWRSFSRGNLDAHNLTGVLLLPFTLVITLSGLMIAHLIYFPKAPDAVYEQMHPQSAAYTQKTPAKEITPLRQKIDNKSKTPKAREGAGNSPARRRFIGESQGRVTPKASGEFATITSIDPLITATEEELGRGAVYMVRVSNPADAEGVIALRLSSDKSVAQNMDNRRFSVATGADLDHFESSSVTNVFNFIAGMHYVQFDHWPLRWFYFIAGLGACVLIATGLLHWTQAHNQKHDGTRFSICFMNVHNLSAVMGIIVATGAFLVANRLFNNSVHFAGVLVRDLEVYVFFSVWMCCVLHGVIRVLINKRSGYIKAWGEQCWAIAFIAISAVILNWLTTGDHLIKTLFKDTYWPVATIDLLLISSAAIAIFAARKLSANLKLNIGR